MVRKDPTPLIISASRTKDMVHRCPEVLADLLLGNTDCRWGPHGPLGRITLENVHSVVLWTKDPHNLLHHSSLRLALEELRSRHYIQIALEITATGTGGSFIEPGIPRWQTVFGDVKELIKSKLIHPGVIVYRYDPFLNVQTPGGNRFSNASLSIFKRLSREFISLGISRVTTSRADAVHYPKVTDRVSKLGLKWIPIDDLHAITLCQSMADSCHENGAEFSVCCDPEVEGLTHHWGCIDAVRLNQIKGNDSPKATEVLHNQIGKQRPSCRCTYSRDIGYSTGSTTCYSRGFGCLYCYSQGNANLPESLALSREIEEFDRDPEQYLAANNLPPELLSDKI